MTVNLVPGAVEALNFAAAEHGDSKTDTVNRAIQFDAIFTSRRFWLGFVLPCVAATVLCVWVIVWAVA